jgi:hypothetical protein
MTTMTTEEPADAGFPAADQPDWGDTSVPSGSRALDDARALMSYFIDADGTVLDVSVAFAAMTHVLDCFNTVPKLLFHADEPECGKTEAESFVLRLSANPWTVNRETTKDAIRSKLDVVDPSMRPTIGIQEVSQIFGLSGRQGAGHPINTYLREGYKKGEKTSISRNGSAVDIEVFCTAVMAGMKNCVPKDIRTRLVCVRMRPGSPQMEYFAGEHDQLCDAAARALGSWARQRTDYFKGFRGRGLHPKLKGRKREIWEALFAIAHAAGGSWPKRMMAAFLDLAIDQAETVPLTPQQTILRDMCRAAAVLGTARVAGLDLLAEMRRFGEPLYQPLPDRSLSMFMAAAMDPVRPYQFRLNGEVVRGYNAADIERLASERLPREPEEDEDDEESMLSELGTIFDVPFGEREESQP